MDTDYEFLYKEKYIKKTNELESDLKDFEKQFSDLRPKLLINNFCRKVSYERDNLIQRHIPYDYEKTAISISKNFFKQELIEEFIRAKDRYAKNPIVHFINDDLPDLQKKHNALFKKNTKSELYEYEPEFLKASHTEIIEFIATHSAMNDYVSVLRKKNEPSKNEALEDSSLNLLKPKPIDIELESDTKSNDKSNYQFTFTKSQQALAIYHILVAMGYESSYSDKTSIARLIHLLAAIDIPKTISNSHIYKKVKLLYSYKKATKSSINDLKTILDVFKPLASGQSDIIDKIINKIESELESYSKN